MNIVLSITNCTKTEPEVVIIQGALRPVAFPEIYLNQLILYMSKDLLQEYSLKHCLYY